MTTQHTSRRANPFPNENREDTADVPRDVAALARALDDAPSDDQGILPNRPVSTSGSPGRKGRYYYVIGDSTPANNGILWRDNGTGWDPVAVPLVIADRSLGGVKLVLATVTDAELAALAVLNAKIANGAVDARTIADALKPSAGAAGGTEALRALGTAAGKAAAGTHAAQHNPGGVDELDWAAIAAKVGPAGLPYVLHRWLGTQSVSGAGAAAQTSAGDLPATVPAAALTGRTLALRVAGTLTYTDHGAGARTAQITFRLKLGGVALFDSFPAPSVQGTDIPFILRAQLDAVDSTHVFATGELSLGAAAFGAGGAGGSTGTKVIDLTAAEALDLTLQWSAPTGDPSTNPANASHKVYEVIAQVV